MKEFKAVQKYIRMSPSKIRPVVTAIKKLSPSEAIVVLPHINKRATEFVLKVIKAAVSAAKSQNVAESELIFSEIQVNEAIRMKRARAASRGRWHGYKRRMSHIRVILKTKDKTENNGAEN